MAAFDFPASPAVGALYDTGTGVIYKWDGTAWRVDVTSSLSFTRIARVVMLGSGNYVKSAGLKYVDVELVGTGGNGGLAPATAAGQSSVGGGAGGGGYVRKLFAASDLAVSEPVVVGLNGSSSGSDGNESTFKGLVAGGGKGGATSPGAGTSLGQTSAAAGGVATGGDVNIPGGFGMGGLRAAHGSPSTAQKGFGGGTALAPNHYSTPVATAGSVGADGVFPGGGGGGAANGASIATNTSGGIGARGIAIFTEYY